MGRDDSAFKAGKDRLTKRTLRKADKWLNFRRWLPALGIGALIAYLSSISSPAFFDERSLPLMWRSLINKYTFHIGQSGFFSYVFSISPNYILHKVGHVVLFGILGVAIYYATRGQRLLSVLFIALFAASDEFHQAFVPGRNARLGDIILDVSAAVLVIMIFCRRERGRGRFGPP